MFRTLVFKLFFFPGSAFYVLLTPLAALVSRRALIRHIRGWARYHDWCTRTFLGVRWRIEGAIPHGPALIAMKHESMYETIQALLFLDGPAPVFKRELMDIPLWGRACKRYGGIVVEREAGAKALRTMVVEAKEIIAEGRPILIFPEGTRVPHGEAPELKAGLSGLYRMLNLPIVPIACDSGRFLPKHGPKRPGLVTFRVGEIIPPGEPREAIESRVHAAINSLNSNDNERANSL
jgi:1-acyl-sn-glycerol-3-phosphate acyltransferase